MPSVGAQSGVVDAAGAFPSKLCGCTGKVMATQNERSAETNGRRQRDLKSRPVKHFLPTPRAKAASSSPVSGVSLMAGVKLFGFFRQSARAKDVKHRRSAV